MPADRSKLRLGPLGAAEDDQELMALMSTRVGVTVRLERVNGIVRSATGTGQYMVWKIAR